MGYPVNITDPVVKAVFEAVKGQDEIPVATAKGVVNAYIAHNESRNPKVLIDSLSSLANPDTGNIKGDIAVGLVQSYRNLG